MSLRSKMVVVAVIMSVIFFGVFKIIKTSPSPMIYGVSFSPAYAKFLGLEPKDVYAAILDEWKFRRLRLSVQWDRIEERRGVYDFRELDWLMDEAERRQAKVVLVVGRKTPRWPECHLPEWAKGRRYEEYKEPLRAFIAAAVERYRAHPALELWQVENEPFLPFGLCEAMPKKELAEEVRMVKRLDPAHPTMVTDSGELSLWFSTSRAADFFGTTMYRVVWNRYIGYWKYNWMPAWWFRARLWMNRRAPAQAYIVELQAEPWIPGGRLMGVPLKEQYKSMNLKQLKSNIRFAAKTGMPRAYLWGAEWWYFLKSRGETEIVEYVKSLEK